MFAGFGTSNDAGDERATREPGFSSRSRHEPHPALFTTMRFHLLAAIRQTILRPEPPALFGLTEGIKLRMRSRRIGIKRIDERQPHLMNRSLGSKGSWP